MADARLRSLERDATNDPAAETRLLRERLRAGTLTEQDLRLAAYLGHAPAAEAIGERPFPPGVRDLQARLIGLYDHGLEAALRAQVALARTFLPQFEAERPGDRRPHAALEAVEAWISCPCEEHAGPCVLASEPALEAARTATRSAASVYGARIAAMAAAQAFQANASPLGRRSSTKWVEELREHGLREDALWRAIVDDVLPWALEGRARPTRRYVASESYEVGERVDHPTFGLGVVLSSTEAVATIEFGGDIGDRKLAHRRRGGTAQPTPPRGVAAVAPAPVTRVVAAPAASLLAPTPRPASSTTPAVAPAPLPATTAATSPEPARRSAKKSTRRKTGKPAVQRGAASSSAASRGESGGKYARQSRSPRRGNAG